MGANLPGLNIFANMPPLSDADVFATTGRVFYVGSVAVPGGVAGVDAAGAYGDTPQKPFATGNYALSQCTAGRGDLVVLLPGHTETLTAALDLDVAGVRVAGLGHGRLRPTFTPSGAIDTVDVSAANCWLHNVRLVGQAADSTASINIGSTDFTCTRCIIEQGATPLVGVTVEDGAARFWFDDCQFIGTAAGPDNAIKFESDDADGWRVTNCIFDYARSAGIDEGVIQSSFETVSGLVHNCTMIAVDTLAIDFNSSVSAQGDGLISNVNIVAGAGIANIDTIVDIGGYATVNVFATDSATEAGSRVPVATPA